MPRFAALFVAIAIPSLLAAQARPIRFDRIGLDEGLPGLHVHSILQDSRGLIWIGTQDGLGRWDGYELEIFRHDPEREGSLSHNWVYALLEDSDGTLWVGTMGGGLSSFDRDSRQFRKVTSGVAGLSGLSNDRVRVLLEDQEGFLWVGTDGGGLNRLDRRSRVVVHLPTSLGPEVGEHDVIHALFEDDAGRVWVGTDGGGLVYYDPTSESFVDLRSEEAPFRIDSSRIRTVHGDSEGWLWVGTTEDGLYRAHFEQRLVERYVSRSDDPEALISNRVRSVFESSDNVIWIGTDLGLEEWVPERRGFLHYRNRPSDSNSLSSDIVSTIFEDRAGVLWFGTLGGGLNTWNPRTSFFDAVHAGSGSGSSLSHNMVTSFAEAGPEAVWVGTLGGGLNHVNLRTRAVAHLRADRSNPSSLNDDRVMSLFTDSTGVLWVGTRASGLNRMESGTFRAFRHDASDPTTLSRDSVTAITQTSDGALWVGTFEGGLNRMAPGETTFSHFVHVDSDPSSLSSDRVISLAAGDPEVLWVGTEAAGLNRLDLRTGRFEIYRASPERADSLSSDAVFSVHQDRRGTVWAGTENGLNRLDRQEGGPSRRAFRHYGRMEGLPNDQVYGILEDEEGFLWLTTNDGLARLDPVTDEFLTFDLSQGLLSAEFNSGAYFRSAAGRMFVGGGAGFNAFVPELLDSAPIPPQVVLTRFQKLNQDVELETALVDLESIVLTHRDYVVSFEFAALDFTAPHKNLYSYKLEGFDPDWVAPSDVRRATYTNLDAGDYVFRVRAANNFGVWNEEGLALRVTVVPPPWKTWWAYTIYAFLIAAMLALFARAQTRKVELEAERSRELERLVALRTRELAERNEDLDVARRRFEQASLTDPLTELRNRRFLAQNIAQSLAAVERFYSRPVSADHVDRPDLAFFICDLDAFKDVNDKYGHAAGNRALVEVARRLEGACRKSDIIVRWGGDEFLVMGRCSNVSAAEDLAERIRSAVDQPIEIGSGSSIRIGCSVGFACYPFFRTQPLAIDWEHVVAIADRALYVAKRNGTNEWVGILGTKASALSDTENLVDLIDVKPDVMAAEGRIDFRSSLRDREAVVWERETGSRRRQEPQSA